VPLRIQICFTCFLITSCSFLGLEKTQSPSQFQALEYYQWVTTAEQEDLAEERRRLDTLPELTNKTYVQLALLLSASSLTTTQSEMQAVALLQTLAESGNSWESHLDYQLLANLWNEQLKQRASLRQAQAENLDNLDKLEKLQQQVDVMMSIEKQLMEREQLLSE